MSYQSWSVVYGEVPSAAKWGILGTNDASFNDGTGIFGLYKNLLAVDSNPYKFSVYRSTAQTPGVNGKIQFNTENFDTNNNFDSTTNFRYTAPVSGFYQLCSNVIWNNVTGSNAIGIAFKKNGTTQIARETWVPTYAAFDETTRLSGLFQLTAGDYVEVFEGNAWAGAVEHGADSCYFTGFLVSRT